MISQEYIEMADSFIQLHCSQFKSMKLPEKYWSTLFYKLKEEMLDAGNYFQICLRVNEDDEPIGYKAICINEEGLDPEDPIGIFLIDHAWTYRLPDARKHLLEHQGLLDRMCKLMNINVEGDEVSKDENDQIQKKINLVIENMWRFNQTYKLSTNLLTDEEREPIWYVMDEFGSSIRHSDTPTVECAPFYYQGNGVTYSIMWPITKLNKGDELTRDYIYGLKNPELRKAKLVPFVNSSEEMNEEDEEEIVDDQKEPGINYFKSGREDESMPEDQQKIDMIDQILKSKLKLESNNNKLNVFTDLISVKEHLNKEKFNFVDDIKLADIIFIRKHFKDYKGLYENSPQCLVNQFPYENVITVKDLLAVVCRRVESSKSFLPVTYNLAYELPDFIKIFRKRAKNNLDNHWILKPWNLARSIDTSVTKNLNQIIRSQETGPKIACKYITNPVLFYRDEVEGGVKFDIRYIVLLKSVNPLTIYTYKVFWLRFANKKYSLDDLDDYEKHFTVMNYRPVNLKQINYDEFIPLFEKQNPDFKWNDIQTKIFNMIRQVFVGATKEKPPKGIADNYQSRAMYAIDLMLDWRNTSDDNGQKVSHIEPMICEVNFMPDCTRACKFHPNFFNDIFDTLFLDDLQHNNVIAI